MGEVILQPLLDVLSFLCSFPSINFIHNFVDFLVFILLIIPPLPIVILCSTADLVSLWHLVKISFLHRYPNLQLAVVLTFHLSPVVFLSPITCEIAIAEP